MDLSTIEGLTPEQAAAILEIHNKETEGLKTNRDAFRTEKEAAAAKATENAQAAEAARQELVAKEQELLKAQGDMEGYRKSVEAEFAKREAVQKELTEKARNALLERDKTSVMAELQGMLHPDRAYAGKVMLSNALNVSYNDEGIATFTFNHNGEVVADSIESFKSWAAENSDYKQVLRGVDSGGAGVTQSNGGTSLSSKKYSDMTLKERAEFNSKKGI